MTRVVTIGAVLVLATAGPATARQGSAPVKVGKRIGAVQLSTLGGERVSLQPDGDAARPTLVEFWATWCGVCRALLPKIAAVHEKYGDRIDVVVVAIPDAQTIDDVRTYAKDPGLHGRVLWDGQRNAMSAFGVEGTGYVFILDPSGTVLYASAGPNQDLDGAVATVLARGR